MFIGTLVAHIGTERYLKIYDRGFLVFPLTLIVSGILLVYVVQINWSLSYYIAITLSALVFLLIKSHNLDILTKTMCKRFWNQII